MSDSHLIFQGDIFKYVLFNYLSPKDILKLQKVFKYPSELFSMSVIHTVENRLKMMFSDEEKYQKFKDLMIEKEGMIAGSFLIQIVLGEYWESSDVDIFYPRDNEVLKTTFDIKDYWGDDGTKNPQVQFIKKEHKPCLSDVKYRPCSCCQNITSFEKFFYDQWDFYNGDQRMNSNPFYYEYMSPVGRHDYDKAIVLTHVKSFLVNNFKFQVMEFCGQCGEEVSHEDFLNETVDFSICNNYFKWNKEGKGEYYFNNLDGILNKSFKFENNNRYQTKERFEKYRQRGFTIF